MPSQEGSLIGSPVGNTGKNACTAGQAWAVLASALSENPTVERQRVFGQSPILR